MRIVHGFGQGKLRKAVAGLLEGHPQVASFRLGASDEGGGGRHHRGAQGLMAFPDSFVEEVRRTADIVRVISEHVALKKMGTSWKGLCPFHNEKTPSFNVRSEPADLPLLRLRRGRRRLQVRDAARAGGLPRGGGVAGPPLRHRRPRARGRPGRGPQGARGDAGPDGGGRRSTSPARSGRPPAPGPASTCWGAASRRRPWSASGPAPLATPGTTLSAPSRAGSRPRPC